MSDEQGTAAPITTGGEQQATAGASGQPSDQVLAPAETAEAQPQPQAQQQPEPEYKFDAPEDVPFDQSRLDALTAIAKEHKVPPEVARKIVDLEVARVRAEAQRAAEMVADWTAKAKADAEIAGPDGKSFDANVAAARSVLDRFGNPALKEALVATGLGSHPDVVRFFVKLGKALGEDGFVRGASPAGSAAGRAMNEDQLARAMFPSMTK